MRNKEKLEEIFQKSHYVWSSLAVLKYALNETLNADNDEDKLRSIANHISESVECLRVYQGNIVDEIEELIYKQPGTVNINN